jgi:hypothetical protein
MLDLIAAIVSTDPPALLAWLALLEGGHQLGDGVLHLAAESHAHLHG